MARSSLKKALAKFVRSGGVTFILSLIVFLGLIIWAAVLRGNQYDILFDLTIFFSFIAASLIHAVAHFISNLLTNLTEDTIKLDTNYERLVKLYPPLRLKDESEHDCLLRINNHSASTSNLAILERKGKRNCGLVRLPIIVDCNATADTKVRIYDSQALFELPQFIAEHRGELLSAHTTSDVYNQLCVRVSYWTQHNDDFAIYTMRTTYYDSLVTNRAMDYRLGEGFSLRDLYQYGPFPPLLTEDSPLSNHLGFNAFVVTSNRKIPFVWRGSKNSIGKRTFGSSIGASLKTKYSLDKNGNLSVDSIRSAVINEVRDELKINKADIVMSPFSQWFIAAYRDLVEGGKPQLLLILHVRKSSEEINKTFQEAIRSKKTTTQRWDLEKRRMEDGERLLWISIDELMECAVGLDSIVLRRTCLQTTPSTAASVALLKDYFMKEGVINESS